MTNSRFFRGAFSVVKRCVQRHTGLEFAAKIINTKNYQPEVKEQTVNYTGNSWALNSHPIQKTIISRW